MQPPARLDESECAAIAEPTKFGSERRWRLLNITELKLLSDRWNEHRSPHFVASHFVAVQRRGSHDAKFRKARSNLSDAWDEQYGHLLIPLAILPPWEREIASRRAAMPALPQRDMVLGFSVPSHHCIARTTSPLKLRWRSSQRTMSDFITELQALWEAKT